MKRTYFSDLWKILKENTLAKHRFRKKSFDFHFYAKNL